MVRRVIVRYQNSTEDFHRFTDRNIRSHVKIWSCDDLNIDDDLAELQRRLQNTVEAAGLVKQLVNSNSQARILVQLIDGKLLRKETL